MRTEPLRVLLLTDELEVGGTQRQIVHLARQMDRRHFSPAVAYFRNRSFLADELEEAGVPVFHIPKSHRVDPVFLRRLVSFLRDGRFDVVHCFAFTAEIWGAVAHACVAASRRPGLITSVRNKYDWYSSTQWELKRWASLRSSRVIANSRAGAEFARERMRLPPGAIEVVYNGVATIPYFVAPPANGTVTAQFVGRLVEQKNVPLLLHAAHRLAGEALPVRFRLAGDGPLRESCEQMVRDLGLQASVEMQGTRNDVNALMRAADMVVLPSVREGLSNVILEAMMAGRPVVASDAGGNPELVEPGVTGLLFPNGDEDGLAGAIRSLAVNAALRERMGRAARCRALERFSVPAMVASMQSHYTECARSLWTE